MPIPKRVPDRIVARPKPHARPTKRELEHQAQLKRRLSKKLLCEDCGARLAVTRKGPLPRFCSSCLKSRAALRSRTQRWKAKGHDDRPGKILCTDCSAEIVPPKKGLIRERCEECYRTFRNKQNAEWRKANPQRVREIKQRCYAKHRDSYRDYGRRYGRVRYSEKREQILEKTKAAYRRDPEKFRQKERDARRSGVVRIRDRERYWSNIQSRLRAVVRARLYPLVIGKIKAGSAISDLGMTIEAFRRYIETLWEPGMSWDNYGSEWDLDHIYPLSRVDLTNRVQFLAACNHRNYRPLWESENHKKHARVTVEASELFAELCDVFRDSDAARRWKPPKMKGPQQATKSRRVKK